MAKPKNVVSDTPVVQYQADPSTFKSIVLRVHKKVTNPDDPYVEGLPISQGENDAKLMSQEFPQAGPFITVYDKGIPVTMTVNELVRDVILSVISKAENN